MAICTRCGTVFNDEDFLLNKHSCKLQDIPPKGKQINMSTGTMTDI